MASASSGPAAALGGSGLSRRSPTSCPSSLPSGGVSRQGPWLGPPRSLPVPPAGSGLLLPAPPPPAASSAETGGSARPPPHRLGSPAAPVGSPARPRPPALMGTARAGPTVPPLPPGPAEEPPGGTHRNGAAPAPWACAPPPLRMRRHRPRFPRPFLLGRRGGKAAHTP